jgi:hypothetical protein
MAQGLHPIAPGMGLLAYGRSSSRVIIHAVDEWGGPMPDVREVFAMHQARGHSRQIG